MSKILFLDTNILVHYQSLEQIDWLKIANADSVKLVITPVNLRELNSIKDSPAHSWFRKRAKQILSKISQMINDSLSVSLKDNVEVYIENRDPDIDFGVHHLNREIQDDNLLALILMYRHETPDADIALITSDDGITLLAKARPQGIPTIRMPDDLRLPDEPDPDREKIKELEQRVRELSSALPRLSLLFEDGNDHATFTLPKLLELPSNSEREQRLEEIKQRHPIKKDILPKQNDKLSLTLGEIEKMYRNVLAADQHAITHYNNELEKFYAAYAEFPFNEVNYRNLKNRIIVLQIWLSNTGTAPAEDIDIHLHFPNGFEIFNEEDLPEHPQPPEPPKFKTGLEILNEQTRGWTGLSSSAILGLNSREFPPPNVSHPKIKRTNSYDVRVHVEKVKHRFQVPFDPLYLVFDSFDSATSFHIDYSIVAANVPNETKGQMHIIIKKDVT